MEPVPPVSIWPLVGPLMSGGALTVAALTGIYALLTISRREIQDRFLNEFRELYVDFWKDEGMSDVRKWILNKNIYDEQVEPVFRKRNAMETCDVTWEEHDILEQYDKFCATMLLIKSYPRNRMSRRHRKLWAKILNADFWIEKIKQRKEMFEYTKKHCNELFTTT